MKFILQFKSSLLLLVTLSWGAGFLQAHEIKKIPGQEEKLLIEVLDEISREHQIYFTYDSDIIKGVTVDYEKQEGESVRSILTRMLSEVNMDFKIFEERFVILYRKDEAGLKSLEQMISHMEEIVKDRKELFANRRVPPVARLNSDKWSDVNRRRLVLNVTGRVMDANGEPLIGVNVHVKGTNNGTATDIDGRFSLNDIDDKAVLVVSYIGYKSQDVAVGGQTSLTIVMQEDVQTLDEVVVVGYGTQRKVNITGSVDVITSDQIADKPVANVGQALQGVIPNLNIEVPSGRPGTNPIINIRGYESITGGSPLILVDGVPRSINDVNTNDIESISILKDASSASIYGARGAFGVILIQTKQGKVQDLQVNFNARYSGEVPIFKIDMVTDPYIHMTEKNKVSQRGNGTDWFPQFLVKAAKNWSENPTPENAWHVENGTLYWAGGGENTLFNNRFFRKVVPKLDYNLNVQGGTESSKYYASVGWVEEPGIFKPEFKGENHKRLNADLRVELNVADWLTLKESLSYTNQRQDDPHNYGTTATWSTLPRFGVAYYTGGFPSTDLFDAPDYPGRDYSKYEGMYIGENNPIPYYQKGGRDINDNHDIYLTQGINIKPIRNLVFRGDFTFRHLNGRQEKVQSLIDKLNGVFDGTIDLKQDEMVNNGVSAPSYIINEYNQNYYYYLNAIGEYELDRHGSPHYFKAMVGFNQEWNINRYGYMRAYDMITPIIQSIAATSGSQNTNSREAHLALRGVFSRLNYNYDNRYLVEFSGRYDGTSRFPKTDRFGFFPSASAGWRLSEEKFMKRFDFLSNFMLRASYGELGNQSVGSYYPYLPTIGIGLSNYLMNGNQITYANPAGLVSPSLTWEKTRTTNFGVNLGLMNQKLSFDFDLYERQTLDMLMRITYPELLGTTAPQENGADLSNRGWELKTTYLGNNNSDLSYNITFSFADNITKITKFAGNPTEDINDFYVGKTIGEIWGYGTTGIFQTEEEVASAADQSQFASIWRPGDIHYEDLNMDGKINPGNSTLDDSGDLKVIGNSMPRYTYGLDLGLTYKRFDLTVFLQGIGKRDYFPVKSSEFWPYVDQGIQKFFIEESWTEDNRDAYFSATGPGNWQVQSRYLQDASYIRLKNVSLRYEFPTTGVLSNIALRRLQLYVTGFNLAEMSNIHKSLDPEYVYERVPYPLSRTFSFGIRAGF